VDEGLAVVSSVFSVFMKLLGFGVAEGIARITVTVLECTPEARHDNLSP
jgi:hypothetical protein